MNQTDLSRVKEDLEVLKQATGAELPFHPKEIEYLLAFALSGFILLLWCLIPHGLDKAWGVSPLILISIFYGAYLDKKKPTSCRQSIMGGWRGWLAKLFLFIAVVAIALWFRKLEVRPNQSFPLVWLTFGGLMCACAICIPGRLHAMALGIFFLIGAVLVMVLDWNHFLAMGFSIGVGGLLTAIWQYIQLKKAQNYVAD